MKNPMTSAHSAGHGLRSVVCVDAARDAVASVTRQRYTRAMTLTAAPCANGYIPEGPSPTLSSITPT
ncbi:hypothetical protein GCM10007198_23510 [Microbacterium aerolatum]|nr:hypothetical protein GCM10007198_23510 [Microbacterium aerolatum]